MANNYHVLIVEDETEQAEMVQEFLKLSGPFQTVWAPSLEKLWEVITTHNFDILLIDYRLPDGNGLSALEEIHNQGFDLPVIMVTGQGDERLAVEAMRHGASDYLVKGTEDLLRLPSLIQKTIRAHKLQRSVESSLEKIRYQALLLNNVRDAIVVWNTQGEITYWNPAAEALYGKRAKECIGLSFHDSYARKFTPAVVSPPAHSTGGYEIERRFERNNGHICWVSSRVSALHDYGANGYLIGYMDVSRDITKRKQAEEALRTSQERYTLATAAAKVGVWDWEIKTGKYYIDPNLKFMLGYSPTEIPDQFKSWLNLVHVEDKESVVRTLKAHLVSKSEEYAHEYRMRHKDGSLRWVFMHGKTMRGAKGEVLRMIGTTTDITERKRMESQIQAVQRRLTQANRLAAIGELASGVAHHINNPLTTIIAETQLILGEIQPGQPGRESAEAIERAGWRVQQTVQKLIDFSQPASNELTQLSVNQTIDDALGLMGDSLRAEGVTLITELADDLPPIQGYVRQLGDLWVNLLIIARGALTGKAEHKVTIRSKRLMANKIMVEVLDNGLPIPPEEMATIFEPNFIHPIGGRGSGMELGICQQIVQQHNGEITAESDKTRGTIFRVIFPLEVEKDGSKYSRH